jgi:hypothetical protein
LEFTESLRWVVDTHYNVLGDYSIQDCIRKRLSTSGQVVQRQSIGQTGCFSLLAGAVDKVVANAEGVDVTFWADAVQ